MNTPAARLRRLLEAPGLIRLPGCFDALSARLIERAGFSAAYMTGFGVSASTLGLPDTGLISFREMADRAGAIARAVSIPVVADADTGYGNPVNVYRTVTTYAREGVAAVQIEDQQWPKRCGHTEGKRLVPLGEATARIRAACDARTEADIVVVARTDARAVEGFEAALERCRAYGEAGADVLFFEAPQSRDELARVAEALDRPLLANVVEGGKTPVLSPDELEAMGYKMAIYPITLLMAAVGAMEKHLAEFGPWHGQPGFAELKDLVGFPAYQRRAARYGPEE